MPCFTFSIFASKKNTLSINADVLTNKVILSSLLEIKLNDQQGPILSQAMFAMQEQKKESTFGKAIRYFGKHGLRKALERSVLELRRRRKS